MEEKDGEHVVDARGENRRNQREIAGERYVAVVGQREQQGRSQRRWRRLSFAAGGLSQTWPPLRRENLGSAELE